MIPRPRIRLPIWAAVAIAAAAYVARSLVLRGGDFALDMPSDAVALTVFIVGVAAVAWLRTTQDDDGGSAEHQE